MRRIRRMVSTPLTARRSRRRARASDHVRAAAFNARDAWCQVDSLYAEFEDMKLTGACSMSALKEARDAVNRALAEAEALAPWWAVQTFAGDG